MRNRVLVIDDELPLRELVKDVLEEAGFEAITAGDGPAGLFDAVARRPHLVVLDVIMPGMDGLAVLRALRQQAETKDLPVLMLTSLARDPDVLRGCLKGADGYLAKPFDPAELVTLARRLLEAGP